MTWAGTNRRPTLGAAAMAPHDWGGGGGVLAVARCPSAGDDGAWAAARYPSAGDDGAWAAARYPSAGDDGAWAAARYPSAGDDGARAAARYPSAGNDGARAAARTSSGGGGGVLAAARTSSGGGGGGSGAAGGGRGEDEGGFLSDRDLKAIEREHPDGLTSVQIVDIFTQRGIRFSEATFRKYVQQGLLPRSRRVGRKGKHQGSLGLYPATTVRRINAIKRLMAENYTIEDIQKQFLRWRDEIEALERGIETLLGGFEEELRAPHWDTQARRDLKREVAEARKTAEELLRRIGEIERRVSVPRERPAGAGAPGGAEDLL